MKLDKLDLKILKELERNCKQPDSQIAKKVRSSKQVVSYRINKYIENRIITSFGTLIDFYRIGINVGIVLIKLKGINKEDEMKMINHMKKTPSIAWIGHLLGRWDFLVSFLFRDIFESQEIFDFLLNDYGDMIDEYKIIFDLDVIFFNGKVIFNSKEYEKFHHKLGDITSISENEFRILKILSNNSRKPILEISRELILSPNTVRRYIKSMIKRKIIRSFTAKISFSKLGYTFVLCFFRLKDFSKKEKMKFINYISNINNVTSIFNMQGDIVDVDMQVEDMNELNTILEKIKNDLGNQIQSVDHVIIQKIFKDDFLPEMIIKYTK